MKNFLLNCLDWIYKKKCYFCGKSKESVKMCSKCFNKIDILQPKVNRIINKTNIYACTIYELEIQKLIRGIKYHKQRDLAYYAAKIMYEYCKEMFLDKKFQVVPVPISEKRLKKRKYNHMELVADEFCNMTGYTKNFELVKRIKDTKPQYGLKRTKRMLNLKDAFLIEKDKYFENMPVLLIDDICTTGSTFENIILELNKNDIYNITCLALSTVGE